MQRHARPIGCVPYCTSKQPRVRNTAYLMTYLIRTILLLVSVRATPLTRSSQPPFFLFPDLSIFRSDHVQTPPPPSKSPIIYHAVLSTAVIASVEGLWSPQLSGLMSFLSSNLFEQSSTSACVREHHGARFQCQCDDQAKWQFSPKLSPWPDSFFESTV